MPNYYNPYAASIPSYGGTNYYYPQQFPMQQSFTPVSTPNNYWISVDGEMAARAWQMPANLAPNTIIPLWDLDGQHVYFKSTDAYGRINPIRKGKVVFEDEPQILPQGESGVSIGANRVEENSVSSNYVTKEDFEGLRHEIQDMLRMHQSNMNSQPIETNTSQTINNGNNQNGSKSSWKRMGDVK